MATHSSILAWRIPGMGEPGGLPSMGSHRVGHDWSDLAAAAASHPYTTTGKTIDLTMVPISLCVCTLRVSDPVLLEHCPALATCLPESVVFSKSFFVDCRIMNKLTVYTPVKVFAWEGKVSTSMNEGQSTPAQPRATYQLRSCHSLNWYK